MQISHLLPKQLKKTGGNYIMPMQLLAQKIVDNAYFSGFAEPVSKPVSRNNGHQGHGPDRNCTAWQVKQGRKHDSHEVGKCPQQVTGVQAPRILPV